MRQVTGIGYGYVTNRIGTKQDGDPHDVALRQAMSLLSAVAS